MTRYHWCLCISSVYLESRNQRRLSSVFQRTRGWQGASLHGTFGPWTFRAPSSGVCRFGVSHQPPHRSYTPLVLGKIQRKSNENQPQNPTDRGVALRGCVGSCPLRILKCLLDFLFFGWRIIPGLGNSFITITMATMAFLMGVSQNQSVDGRTPVRKSPPGLEVFKTQ